MAAKRLMRFRWKSTIHKTFFDAAHHSLITKETKSFFSRIKSISKSINTAINYSIIYLKKQTRQRSAEGFSVLSHFIKWRLIIVQQNAHKRRNRKIHLMRSRLSATRNCSDSTETLQVEGQTPSYTVDESLLWIFWRNIPL